MKFITIFLHVGERLFDELVKEWLKSRYTIVSGTFREVNGRRTRVRKGHPGLPRGGVFRDASLRFNVIPIFASLSLDDI